jgi:hypothetical protein
VCGECRLHGFRNACGPARLIVALWWLGRRGGDVAAFAQEQSRSERQPTRPLVPSDSDLGAAESSATTRKALVVSADPAARFNTRQQSCEQQ